MANEFGAEGVDEGLRTGRNNDMKKLTLIVVTLLLTWSAVALTGVVDGDVTWFCEEFQSGGKTCVRIVSAPSLGRQYSGDLSIPSSLLGSPVTQIDYEAFCGCAEVTSVSIPMSVTSIGQSAFSGCSGLTSVSVPPSVMSIGSGAFSGCNNLESVTISDGVRSIGDSAFAGCSSLISVTIPKSVASIGYRAFYGCSGLISMSLPFVGGSRRSDSDSALGLFGYIFGSKEAYLYSDVTSAMTQSYNIPPALIFVEITDETRIGYGAFYNCCGLTKVIIQEGVTSIGDFAFYGCSGITGITIPSSVTSIGQSAFYGCEGLVSAFVPQGVTSIGNRAFYGCNNLTTAEIPSSVKKFGDYVFSGCNNLISVKIPAWVSLPTVFPSAYANIRHIGICSGVSSIGDWAFEDCDRLTSVTISEGVESIGRSAFYGCNGLTSVTLPSSVSSIGYGAFNGCASLNVIHVSNNGNIEALKELLRVSGLDVDGVTFDHEDEPDYRCRVEFDTQGGVATWTEASVCKGATIGTLPTVERDGYEFLGWFTLIVGGTQVTTATVVQNDVTYYAQWKLSPVDSRIPDKPQIYVSEIGGNINSGYVEISWADVEGAESYNLYRSNDDSYHNTPPCATGITSPYRDYRTAPGLTPGVKYYYGCSGKCGTVSGGMRSVQLRKVA